MKENPATEFTLHSATIKTIKSICDNIILSIFTLHSATIKT